MAELAVALPRLADKVDHAAGLFGDRDRTPGLTDRDRRLAAQAEQRIRELLDQLKPNTPLHGEPHDGNVIWTSGGPLLIDFEASCTGPLEWDLAYLPDEARGAFPDRDDALIERLRAVVSYCVAAWCWAQPERAPEVDAAAKHHLDLLARSWLAA
jgi:Ser/Thr protein kinase RdoA (MazF antagonist)